MEHLSASSARTSTRCSNAQIALRAILSTSKVDAQVRTVKISLTYLACQADGTVADALACHTCSAQNTCSKCFADHVLLALNSAFVVCVKNSASGTAITDLATANTACNVASFTGTSAADHALLWAGTTTRYAAVPAGSGDTIDDTDGH